MEFSLDKTSWKTSIADLNDTVAAKQDMTTGKTKTVTLYWRWAFNSDTTKDTTIGESTQLNETANQPKVTVSMEATQVD